MMPVGFLVAAFLARLAHQSSLRECSSHSSMSGLLLNPIIRAVLGEKLCDWLPVPHCKHMLANASSVVNGYETILLGAVDGQRKRPIPDAEPA